MFGKPQFNLSHKYTVRVPNTSISTGYIRSSDANPKTLRQKIGHSSWMLLGLDNFHGQAKVWTCLTMHSIPILGSSISAGAELSVHSIALWSRPTVFPKNCRIQQGESRLADEKNDGGKEWDVNL